MYLSLFFTKYALLSDEEKEDVLVAVGGVWNRSAEDSDDDSVMTPPRPSHWHAMKAAAKIWYGMEIELKEAWKERAERLNQRPRNDGTFERVPVFLNDAIVKQSLTNDWRHFVGIMRHAVISNVDRYVLENTRKRKSEYKFGNERVLLNSQRYQSLYMNHMLKLTIFGCPLFSNLLGHEMAYRTEKQVIVYFYSHRRVSELFEFGGLNGTKFFRKGKKYMCIPKVNLRTARGRNIIGYVMDEVGSRLKVQVEGENEWVDIERPEFVQETGRFDYIHGQQSDRYQLSELWPIRIKLNHTGHSAFIISCQSYCMEEEPEYIL